MTVLGQTTENLHRYLGGGVIEGFNSFCSLIHQENVRWWTDLKTGRYPIERNKGEMIALMHSELSETLEGVRKGKMDDHLPHRKAEEVELADLIIRVADYAGAYGLDLSGAIREKLEYNAKRQDHRPEARLTEGGKKL